MKRLERPCPVCGNVFAPRKAGGTWTKTCSRECGNQLVAATMRAGGGRRASLARKRPDKVELRCQICGHEWSEPPSQVRGRKTCSRACAAELKRQRGGTQRIGARNPNFRHGKRAGVRDRDGERRWYVALTGACSHPNCERQSTTFALHHVIYRQHLRWCGGDEWDPRNALTLCDVCHSSHHRSGRFKVPASCLPDEALEFAFEVLGAYASDYLSRRYADVGKDGRVAVLLEAAWERRAA